MHRCVENDNAKSTKEAEMANKTTITTVDAFLKGQNNTANNTTACHADGKSYLFLFGNQIACKENNRIKFRFCGWNTTTTRARLKYLLNQFGLTVWTKQGDLFVASFSGFNGNIKHIKINAHDWYYIDDLKQQVEI